VVLEDLTAAAVARPLPTVTVGDIEAFVDAFTAEPSCWARTLPARPPGRRHGHRRTTNAVAEIKVRDLTIYPGGMSRFPARGTPGGSPGRPLPRCPIGPLPNGPRAAREPTVPRAGGRDGLDVRLMTIGDHFAWDHSCALDGLPKERLSADRVAVLAQQETRLNRSRVPYHQRRPFLQSSR
jgi:hypothetical protein